jgi:hypothetical protein
MQRIQVTDISGKVVYLAKPDKTKTAIDLGAKTAGVYFYEIDYGGRKQRGKLVIY